MQTGPEPIPVTRSEALKETEQNKTRMAVGVFDLRANEYQDKFMNVDLYGDALDLFCDSVQAENARVLDIACGPGNLTRYLLDRRPDFQVLGIDLSPNMLLLAQSNDPEAEFRLMDCREITRLDETYDAIVCGFCLPYLSKEEALALLRDACGLLRPGGVLYLSTMENTYSGPMLQRSSYGDELFMYYHEAGYLTKTLEENGCRILTEQYKSYPAPDGTMTTDLVVVAMYSAL